ncbi:MAG: CHAT domain-containing protein [Kouleothrix sp.]|nr:CHAT domain-containing protein [Kouleothrix sp.]
MFEQHGHAYADLLCRHALILADVWATDRAGLHDDFAALAEQLVVAGAPLEAARCQLDQARQLCVLGRPDAAEAVLGTIAPLLVAGDSLDQARWLRTRGTAAYLRAAYDQARALLADAEQIFITHRYPLEIARCWTEQARVAFLQEQPDRALALYQRAEQVYRRYDVPIRLAYCSKTIGLALMRQGIYDAALAATLRALRQFVALGRDGDIGGCQLNLGNIYYYTARWEAALACYARAEALCAARGLLGEQLMACRNRALVYRALGRWDEAHFLLTALENQARMLNQHAELAELVNMRADLFADAGQDDLALVQYQRAQELFAQHGNLTSAAVCALEQGWLQLRRGGVDGLGTLQQRRPRCDTASPPALARKARLARCAESRGVVAEALRHYRAAVDLVGDLRRRLASEMISSSLAAQAASLYTDALRAAAACGAAETLLEIAEAQRALVLQRQLATQRASLPREALPELALLRERIGALLDYGDVDDGALDAALDAYGTLLVQARHADTPLSERWNPLLDRAFDLARVRETLSAAFGDDWTILVYLVSGAELLAVTVMPDGLALQRTLRDEAIDRLIAQASTAAFRAYTYRDFVYQRGATNRRWDGLCLLAEQLLPPQAIGRLHPGHRLLIVPAGPLHTLPWAALRLEGGWLAEQAIVQLLPSLTIWQALADKPAVSRRAALLVGCQTFGDRAPPLPGVADELAAIARHWPAARALPRDGGAQRDDLIDQSASGELEHYAVLHFATHAQLLPARGMAAHIKLGDGDLLLPEIANLRLGSGLVTLSTCDGAAADVLPGEEVLSLSWAFLAAGAGTVLASLWPVYDAAAILIMDVFYAELAQCGDAAMALAHAQRTLIAAYEQTGDAATEPQYWGSYVVTGKGLVVETTGGTAPPPS